MNAPTLPRFAWSAAPRGGLSAFGRPGAFNTASAGAECGVLRKAHAFAHITRLAAALQAGLRAMELRIDVAHPADNVEGELQEIQNRFAQRLRGQCAQLPLQFEGLRFWHRQADAEHYVYVERAHDGVLVGYTVLNRLIEVDRALDPHVRSPHTRIAPAYQGRGIATAVYRWALDSGLCLVSGARQSQGAHALWASLGRSYHLAYVQLIDKQLRLLGPRAPSALRDKLQTRLMLFGVDASA